MKNRAVFNWSGGKDSALALYEILRDPTFEIRKLTTTLSAENKRISMHGVREELLIQQAKCIGLPLEQIQLPSSTSMEVYNSIMAEKIKSFKADDITHSIFGDIFLEDLRNYREEQLKKVGLIAVFPLWKRNTKEILKQFLALGFKTITVSTHAQLLDKNFCGRIIDEDFIDDLPENVDPCGENGEFHTFVFDGPIFTKPIDFTKGEILYKEYDSPDVKNEKVGFYFCDLIPVEG